MRHEVVRFRAAGGDNYQYLLVAADEALVVDPLDTEGIRRRLELAEIRLAGILVTHTHWDHVEGVAALARDDLPVYVHGDHTHAIAAGRPIPVGEGDRIPWAGGEVTVSELPGHHPSHLGYHWAGTWFVGDTLFLAGCGNPNFGGDLGALFTTLWERVRTAPSTWRLAWGHDYAEKNLAFAVAVDPDNPALPEVRAEVAAARAEGREIAWRTLADELALNPFLRCDQPAVVAAARRRDPTCDGTPRDVFRVLRRWRDTF